MKSITAALSWDGARVPVSQLPPKARSFLNTENTTLPSAKKMAELFANESVKELRICWVPQLRGGKTLAEPFPSIDGKRLPFRLIQSKRLGNCLGVIYRR